MAKKSRLHLTDDGIDSEIMKQARERAIRKKADMIAAREIGISDDGEDVIKGPLPVKGEKQFTITLDLAPHSDRLMIDSKIYLQSATYTVGERLYNTMREMIHRGWEHQREIDGKDGNMYRNQSNVRLSPNGVAA
jgi:hypothetical protein